MSKKTEIQEKASQFPKIYRFITERIEKSGKEIKILTAGFVFGLVLTLVVLACLDLASSFRNFKEIKVKRQTLVSQVSYWEKVVKKQEGYRDGYFMLAVLEYQLKQFDKSKEYLKKALSIDPNFSPAQDLQKALK